MKSLETFTQNLFEYATLINLVLSVLLVLVGFRQYKKLNTALIFFLFYCMANLAYYMLEYAFIYFATNYYQFCKPFLTKFNITDTFFLSIISRLIDYVFLSLFFIEILDKKYKPYIKWISIILFFGSIYVYFYIDGYNKYGIVNPWLNRIYLVALPLLYLITNNHKNLHIAARKNPYLLICYGLLIIHLLSFLFTFFAADLQETNYTWFSIMSIFKNILAMVGQFFFGLAFWNARYAPKK